MVENRTRGEQLFQQARESRASSGGGKTFAQKATDALKSAGKFFFMPLGKIDPKPTTEAKAPGALFSGALSGHKLDLKSVNQILVLVLIGLMALTGYVTFGEKPDIASVTATVSKIKFQDLPGGKITPFQELAFYLDQIRKRDIFNEYEEPKPPPPVVKPKEPDLPPPPPKVTLQEKAKNFKLMGVSWGIDRKVIIKNESTQEIYFLQEGQRIKGTDISVKKILKGEVVIASEDEEMKML